MGVLKLFQRKNKFNLEDGHVITPVFVSGGVQYYKLQDVFNTYCKRALEALDIYENWGLNKTKEQDRADWEKVLQICNTQPIVITDIIKLAILNIENSELVLPPEEIIWKMASVMYFDENESPYHYDEEYCKKKIEKWKQDKKLDFFLSKHLIGSLIPLPDLSQSALESYLEVAQKIREKQKEVRSDMNV